MGYSLAGAALLGLAGLDVCVSFVPAATFRPELTSSLRFFQESSTSNKGKRTNWGERRNRAAAAAAAVGPIQATKKSKEEQESDVFDWLASNAGVDKIVSLGTVAGGGYRGLVMNSDVEEGQVRCTMSPRIRRQHQHAGTPKTSRSRITGISTPAVAVPLSQHAACEAQCSLALDEFSVRDQSICTAVLWYCHELYTCTSSRCIRRILSTL